MEDNTQTTGAQRALMGTSNPLQTAGCARVPNSQLVNSRRALLRTRAERYAWSDDDQGNTTLAEILSEAVLSKSSAYAMGLVPMYEKDGTPIESKKIPPLPWIKLPDAVVKQGKKRWAKADIKAWFRQIRGQDIDSTPGDICAHSEVSA